MGLPLGLKEAHLPLLQMLELFLVLLPLQAHLEETVLQRLQRFQQRLQRCQEIIQRHRVLQKLLQIPLCPEEPPFVLQEHLGLIFFRGNLRITSSSLCNLSGVR